MADLLERIQAECENIKQVLAELASANSLEKLSTLELAGVATLIHNFYNGIENILKQILLHQGIKLPTGPSWHRELLDIAESVNVISSSTLQELRRYLAFRHFFSHGYAFDLKVEIIKPLAQDADKVFESFQCDFKK